MVKIRDAQTLTDSLSAGYFRDVDVTAHRGNYNLIRPKDRQVYIRITDPLICGDKSLTFGVPEDDFDQEGLDEKAVWSAWLPYAMRMAVERIWVSSSLDKMQEWYNSWQDSAATDDRMCHVYEASYCKKRIPALELALTRITGELDSARKTVAFVEHMRMEVK